LESLLRAAGFEVKVVENAQSLLWGKLVINAAINPLTAILRVPNGELLQLPAARLLMAELAKEAAAVGLAHGASLPFEDPVAAVENVAQRTAANRSSMLQDVLRGAQTEVDAICGAIVRNGEEKGIPVPVNRAMVHMLETMKA
jgi:2-dehydropantoate 2-reductase